MDLPWIVRDTLRIDLTMTAILFLLINISHIPHEPMALRVNVLLLRLLIRLQQVELQLYRTHDDLITVIELL